MEPPSDTLEVQGMVLAKHTWKASTGQPRGVAVVYHGFLAHSQYPTVRYAAELCSSAGFDVIAVDLPGHGKSPGTRGYLPSADSVIEGGIIVAKHAHDLYEGKLPLFLVGSSLGGCIAVAVSTRLGEKVAGAILLAPMLAINVAEPLKWVLRGLSFFLPTCPLISNSATSSSKQYRDPEKRRECDADELTGKPGANMRVASASTCVELASSIRNKFVDVTCPFLCMLAEEDVVVCNTGAEELFEKAPSPDKTMKRYDALHGLLCEPSPLIDEIQTDILSWLNNQTATWHSKHRTLV